LQINDLRRRFKEATSNRSVTLDSLKKNKVYPFLKAERVQIENGVSIFLTVNDSCVIAVRVYLNDILTYLLTSI
jgi:hypothetical protein